MAATSVSYASRSDLDRLEKKFDKTLTPIEGLLKTLAEPASKLGLTPAQLLAKGGGNDWGGRGQTPHVIMGDGRQVPFYGGGNQKRLGDKFGQFLEDLYFNAGGDKHPVKHRTAAVVKDAEDRLFNKKSEEGGWCVQKAVFSPEFEKAALAESSGVTGGYTVPPMFSQQLQMLAIEGSVIYARATRFPMTSLTLLIPTLDQTTAQTAGTTPFLGGILASWTSEAATRAESEPQFRQMELKAWELSFYTVASNTLLADNAVGLDSLLTELFSMAIAWYTDYAYLQGDGVGKPMGILNAAATLSVARTTANTFTYVDMTQMMSKLYMMLWRSNKAAWFMHQSVLPSLMQMNDASGTTAGTGRVLWVPISEGAQYKFPESAGIQSAGYLAGIPVIFTEKLPTVTATAQSGDVLLADCSKYVLGERAELAIDVSPHVRFLNNQMVWRTVWRGDGQPWLNNPVTLADGAYTVSPFVKLGPHA